MGDDGGDAVSAGRAIVLAAIGAFYAVPPSYCHAPPPAAYTSGPYTYYTHVLGHVFAADQCSDAWLRVAGEELCRQSNYAEARLVRLDGAHFLLTYRM